MSTCESEPVQLLLLPRTRKDELNQMKGNTEGVGGSKKPRSYFLKYPVYIIQKVQPHKDHRKHLKLVINRKHFLEVSCPWCQFTGLFMFGLVIKTSKNNDSATVKWKLLLHIELI